MLLSELSYILEDDMVINPFTGQTIVVNHGHHDQSSHGKAKKHPVSKGRHSAFARRSLKKKALSSTFSLLRYVSSGTTTGLWSEWSA